jgi:hypothetical protein
MRRIWLLLGLCACGETPRPVVHAQYRPAVASESWCRLGTGVFAFVPRPQVGPALLGSGCTAPRRDPAPAMARVGSTLAELVVEPGGSIEIPVQLPKVLQGVGCRIDSVLIPHGRRISDLAIEIASAGRAVPIVSYERLPPPPEEGVSPRTVVSDGSGLRRAIWAPDAPPGENSLAVIADPELWPTGAVLRFDGAQTADGAASVAFEIEKEPEPPLSEEPVEPEPETPTGASPPPPAPAPDAPTEPVPPEPVPPEGDSPPASTPPPIRQPTPLVLVAYRHRIDIAAPASFSIVLRARERAFGIGVRSDRESADPQLTYRAPGAAEPTPTHLVPQVGVVVSRCGRPVEEILRDIR